MVFKEFTFDAAHYLTNVPADHKCAKLHGHTYHVRIEVAGPINVVEGWVMDLGELGRIGKELVATYDHTLLNTLLPNPTVEALAYDMRTRLNAALGHGTVLPWVQLHAIEIRETPTSGVRLEP